MKWLKRAPDEAQERRIAGLVRELRVAERELERLTNGQLDAVSGESGEVYLLQVAQARLRQNEAELRRLAARQLAVFDALPAHIALLDERGVIREVNSSWRAFASANGGDLHELGAGADYLAACDRAAAAGDESAAAVAAGLRALLAGERSFFALEYPCHSPSEQRWFRVMVTPLEHQQIAGAVVTHVDVTERRLAEMALRDSERRYRRLFEESPHSMWIYDLETLRFLAVNEAALRKYGYSAERFLSMTIAEIRPPEDVPALRERVASLVESTPDQGGVWRHRLADGRTIEVEIHSQPADFGGRRARLIMAIDVTARQAAVAELAASEERLRLLARATNDAIWDWDLRTDSVWWNDGLEALFGYRPEECASGAAWLERVHDDDRERIRAEIERALEPGTETWAAEYRYRRRDGSWAYVLDRGYLLRDVDGRAIRMIGGMTDLTERRRAEERVAEQAALLDAAQEAILVKDLDDRILFWNKGAERTYGCSAERALGRRVDELIERDPEAYESARAALFRDGQWRGELRHRDGDGSERVVEVGWTLVRDSDGRPASVLAINADVTERKNLEAQLLRVQRLESVGRLAGGIAHDLNNVLAPILMAVELLREDEIRADRLDLLSTVESSAQRGADLIHQVLSFSRGIEGERKSVDLEAVSRDVVRILRDTFPKNIATELRVSEELWTISADATQMHQVLMNLCVNARDAMPKGGRLTVAIENVSIDDTYAGMNRESRPGPHVLVEVTDTGVGIAPQDHAHLFEPFFTTKKLGGTGLGLSTVHTIVRGHGGFVTVYSEPGKGACFKVYLPAEADRDQVERSVTVAAELPRGAGELVLVVDDEESVRNVAGRTLERFGYRVLTASNGAEAVALFAQRRDEIAVVLTDMSMPILDGPSTIVALQAIDPRVRVVGSSGLVTNDLVLKSVEAGVRIFVPKPYSVETLLRALRRAIDESD